MRVSSNKLLQKYAQPTSHNAVTLLSAQNLSDSNFPEAANFRSEGVQKTVDRYKIQTAARPRDHDPGRAGTLGTGPRLVDDGHDPARVPRHDQPPLLAFVLG